ncbi:MAG: hypothetical protein WA655_05440 [Candidatus Korobacteraceae bacterium]
MSGGGGRGFSGGGGYAGHSGGAYGYRGGSGVGGGAYAYHGNAGYARVPSSAGVARPGAYWNSGARAWNGTGWNGNRRAGWNGNSWTGWHGNNWNGWHGNNWAWRNGSWWYRPWGFGWGSPWWGFGWNAWGGYPGWGWYGGVGWDDSYYSYPAYSDTYSAQSYPSYVTVAPGSSDYSQQTQTQQDEINQLNAEVDTLRSQQQAPPSAARPQGKMTEIHAETVLIYRDGHAEEIENYAIVGKTLWVFNEARAKKIPLAELDLPATKRDNEDRGINFVVPASSH